MVEVRISEWPPGCELGGGAHTLSAGPKKGQEESSVRKTKGGRGQTGNELTDLRPRANKLARTFRRYRISATPTGRSTLELWAASCQLPVASFKQRKKSVARP